MNAIDLLKKDHKRVKAMLAELTHSRTRDGRDRTELLQQIARELEVHTAVEEEIFYPEFRRAVEAIEVRVLHAIERLLAALRDEGRLRVDDVGTAAFLIHTSTEWSAARLMLGESDPRRVDAAVEATTDMISRFLFRE